MYATVQWRSHVPLFRGALGTLAPNCAFVRLSQRTRHPTRRSRSLGSFSLSCPYSLGSSSSLGSSTSYFSSSGSVPGNCSAFRAKVPLSSFLLSSPPLPYSPARLPARPERPLPTPARLPLSTPPPRSLRLYCAALPSFATRGLFHSHRAFALPSKDLIDATERLFSLEPKQEKPLVKKCTNGVYMDTCQHVMKCYIFRVYICTCDM